MSFIGLLLPIAAAGAQNQMPDQRAASRMVAGPGLMRNGRTLSLSVPVAASNGGAGTTNGILKANGSGTVSAAISGIDYEPPITGNSLAPHNFANSINGAGAISGAQPGFGDLTGSVASSQMPALTGDTTSTAGSTLTTTLKVNGVSYASNPSTDTVPIITGANTATYTPLSNCPDSGGDHLNYSTATHTFSCGTTSSASNTPPFVTAMAASTELSSYGGL